MGRSWWEPKSFVGSTPSEARTVVSGVAGGGARSVTVYTAGTRRQLKLGPQGSFITVYAGEAEEVRPRVVIVTRDGHAHTIALEQSGAFEVPDPEGGSAWAASTEPDLEPNAFPDEDCVQAIREPSQSEPMRIQLPLTPEICGRLSTSPLFVQMRRFVPEKMRRLSRGTTRPRGRSSTAWQPHAWRASRSPAQGPRGRWRSTAAAEPSWLY